MTSDPVITVLEAARILRCSERVAWELVADGTLERAPKFGRATVVYTSSVLKALEKPRRKNAKDKTPRAHRPGRVNPTEIRPYDAD